MKTSGFSPPVMKIFSDKKPGFSKCIFTVKIFLNILYQRLWFRLILIKLNNYKRYQNLLTH
ncbi:Uncharacterized protein dnm_046420 [Desulfonema magnum]|uniref:Uncharacterized protein n=1 Tax=Desulfonema magnum TaxID=45655 RepID=A0A975BNA1_9BACT|nr:Uncharacterized protein dnm_046420 [Desulfonema magnum]